MIIEGQPKALREAMKFFAAMMMVEKGLMRLVKKVPGDDGVICIFENLAGDLIGVKRPMMSVEREAEILETWDTRSHESGSSSRIVQLTDDMESAES